MPHRNILIEEAFGLGNDAFPCYGPRPGWSGQGDEE